MKRHHRSGFSIIETGMAIALVGIVTVSAITYLRSANRTAQIQMEIDYKATFEEGMKSSFESILDTFEPICSSITSDAQSKWGWGSSQCDATSPFPTYLAPEKIRYRIEFSSLSAQNKKALENDIVGAYSPYCTLDSVTNTQIDLRCPNLNNLTYDLGGGAVASAHTVATDIDPTAVPVTTITIMRREGDGTYSPQTHNISFLDVYEKRRQFSIEKMSAIQSVLKTYYNNQLSLEVANSPTTGLNSIDDEFVPWQWKSFGDNTSSVLGSICDTAGGNTCSNLNTDNIWRNSLSGDGLYMRRIVVNLLSGDFRLTTDGFGNQMTFYPFMSQCANNDITTCAVTAPPVPQKDYFNIMRPPYVSALYIDTFKDKTVVAPAYGRVYISY